MKPFTTLTATACPLGLANIDTDQLIPARFMKRSRDEGYGSALLHDLRFAANGAAKPDFLLNQSHWSASQILIAGRNFGGGSSREAAVYALVDYGIRCVIAPGFGDIFSSNAVNNGLLPARLAQADCDTICQFLQEISPIITVNLESQTISAADTVFKFEIDPVWRLKLLNGWDDIALTASHSDEITAFSKKYSILYPWKQPVQTRE